MKEAIVYNQKGEETGKIKLPQQIFGVRWNPNLVHQVWVSMTGNARTPVAHAKTRGEVRGGGRKPWRQKGTGRARHGSTRSPIWVGGGVTHGPRNERDYSRKINKKEKEKALFSVFSKKLEDNEIVFIDSLNFDKPNTKLAKEALKNVAEKSGIKDLTTKKKNAAVVGLPKADLNVQKSFNNLSSIEIELFKDLNVVDLLKYKYLVIVNPDEVLSFLKEKTGKNIK